MYVLKSFPARQPVMLIDKMLMTRFLGIGNLSFPSTFLHDFLGPKYGFFKAIMTVKTGRVFDQVWIVDIPPAIVPRCVVNGTGYKMAELYGFGMMLIY
jgi:hypothetical protein